MWRAAVGSARNATGAASAKTLGLTNANVASVSAGPASGPLTVLHPTEARQTSGPGSSHRDAPRDGPVDSTGDGRFPGSRVVARNHLPGFPVVHRLRARRLQLRGQPRHWATAPVTAFPLIPLVGNRRLVNRGGASNPSIEFPAPFPNHGRSHCPLPARSHARARWREVGQEPLCGRIDHGGRATMDLPGDGPAGR